MNGPTLLWLLDGIPADAISSGSRTNVRFPGKQGIFTRLVHVFIAHVSIRLSHKGWCEGGLQTCVDF